MLVRKSLPPVKCTTPPASVTSNAPAAASQALRLHHEEAIRRPAATCARIQRSRAGATDAAGTARQRQATLAAPARSFARR